MKKYIIVFVIILMVMVTLIGNSTSKHITFPFEKTDIVEVEMYHYEGVPAAEEISSEGFGVISCGMLN